MSEPLFVPHVTLDGIIMALGFVGTVGLYFINKQREAGQDASTLDALMKKVDEHGVKLDRLVAVAETQARHDERILGLERRADRSDERWDELRHGEGYVLPLPFRPKPGKSES